MKYNVSYRPDEVRNCATKYAPEIVEAKSQREAIAQVAQPSHLAAWEWRETVNGASLQDPDDSYGYYMAEEIE